MPVPLAPTTNVTGLFSGVDRAAGCVVISGAPSRMSCTCTLTTEPRLLLTLTAYTPAADSSTLSKRSTADVSPAIGTLFASHWYDSGPLPVAATASRPEPPGGTINVAGCVVMVGGEVAPPGSTVSVAGLL